MVSLVKNVVTGFIALVVGVTLAPIVADTVFGTYNVNGSATNITGTDRTLIELITTLFVIGIMLVAVNLFA